MEDTLKNSYTKNLDYTITKGKSTGGRPAEIIMLTPGGKITRTSFK